MRFKFQLKSIVTKLIVTNAVIMLIITGFVFYITAQNNIDRLRDNLKQEIDTYISFIAQDLVKISVLDSVDIATDLTTRLSSFAKINKLSVFNKDKEGIFYYKKEGYQAVTNQPSKWLDYDQFTENEFISLNPLLYYESQYGYVWVNVSTHEINDIITEYRQQAYAFIFSLVFVTVWIIILFRSLISKPIRKLLIALKNIADTGDFSSFIKIQRDDEIGKLIAGFNHMQTTIQQTNKKLSYQKFALDEHAIVAVTDVKGSIIFANNKFNEISGYSQDELIGFNHNIINSGKHSKEFFKQMYDVISNGSVWHGEICNQAKDGNQYWVDTTIAPFLSESGKPESYIAIHTDITKLKQVQKDAEYLSYHDVLTGLPNRIQVEVQLSNVLERAKRNGKIFALVFIDLNKFKFINDTLGHDTGDIVLTEVAKKLKNCLRKVDFVARHGGDEFVAIIENVGDEIKLSHLLDKMISEIEKPILIKGKSLYVGVSMGVSLYPGDAKIPNDMLSHADIAMYLAKENSQSNFKFYTKDLNQKVLDRYKLEAELRNGLDENELFCVFQPKVNMISNEIIGAEVLIRWLKKDNNTFISPSEFIPVAESSGLINEIWDLVLDQSLTFSKRLNERNKKTPLALNVCALQFNNVNLAQEIINKVKEYSLPSNALDIEITESLVIAESSQAIDILNTLSDNNIGIAIDDFGTGYSSLKYLKMFPITLVKLDISFISGIGVNKEDEQLVKTMIDMALGLGINVIAEGVETENQRDFLIANGCKLAQGYLYSKPLTNEDFLKFIQAN